MMQQHTTLFQHWTILTAPDISAVHYLHLIYWNNGLTLIGFSENDEAIQAELYEWTDKFSTEDLTAILLDEPLLGGNESVKNIWIASDRNMLIPKQLFDIKEASNWFAKLHFVDHNESIEISHISKPAGYSLDAVRTDFLDTIIEHANEAPLVGLLSCLLSNFDANKYNLGITFLGHKAVIQAYKDKQLQMVHLVPADEASLMHYIYEIGDQYKIAQTDFKVLINGFNQQMEATTATLSHYFSINTTEDTNSFFNSLAACE